MFIVGLTIFIMVVVYKLYKNYIISCNSTTSTEFSKNNVPKIAFIFLTYNKLKRPDIWNKFFKINNPKLHSKKYTVYNHAKEPEKAREDLILKGRIISKHIDTCWGCLNLVEANLLMMKEALKDPLNMKFILVSDACVPIVSFDRFYDEIMKDDKSKMNIFYNNSPERYDSIINPPFTKDKFIKHNGSGLILNRKHAELLVADKKNYIKDWVNVHVPDEHYFGNILNILDPKFNLNNDNIQITYDKWSRAKINNKNIDYNVDIVTDSYINIKAITNKAIDELRDKKFLFVRKVDGRTKIDVDYIFS